MIYCLIDIQFQTFARLINSTFTDPKNQFRHNDRVLLIDNRQPIYDLTLRNHTNSEPASFRKIYGKQPASIAWCDRKWIRAYCDQQQPRYPANDPCVTVRSGTIQTISRANEKPYTVLNNKVKFNGMERKFEFDFLTY